ncbi:uncharacterized protein LTR77_005219 [Saxophila tyrrhenica]|uniref:Heterokaryon incompatibility domain-containing protein n=1 Tax=Saxophila tyrrhenica TaxID=1690608 RepID=A0AAV9PEL0_9PEZI|nr:hypothetical protein LTR77_005219 [Saxophila tyrrhenica]
MPSEVQIKATYKPLDSGKKEFRILILQAGQHPDIVRANLRIDSVAAEQTPQYETIPYCWGSSDRREQIEVDGHMIQAPASSVDALRRVRLPDRERAVWIDSLCINQQDPEERTQQVAMMGDVYSKGDCNVIYLGEGDETTSSALRSIEMLAQVEPGEDDEVRRPQEGHRSSGRPTEDPETPGRFDVDVEACNRVFSLPWFGRLWVFQEASLSVRNRCLIGTEEVDMLDLLRANYVIAANNDPQFHRCRYSGLLLGLLLLRHAKPEDVSEHQPFSFLLCRTGGLRVSEPRDFIFALLGIYQSWTAQRRLDALLTPDYRKPVTEVFRDAVRFAIIEDGNLWWLQQVNPSSLEEIDQIGLPSWAIDMRQWDAQRAIIFEGSYEGAKIPTSSIWQDNRPNLMSLRGVVARAIKSASRTLEANVLESATLLACWILETLGTSSTIDLRWTAFLEALGFGRQNKWEGGRRVERVELIAYLRHWASVSRDPQSTEQQIEEALRAMKPFAEALLSNDSMNRNVLRPDMKFCCDEAGNIGLAPQLSQEGDLIVVLYGGRPPFVLRPCEEDYRLLGPC